MAGTQISVPVRGGGSSALLALLDGLVDRMLRSPLMRRAPVQCGPEEQAAQAALLVDIVNARALRAAAESLPALPFEVVAEHWPDLAAALGPARRSQAAKARPATTGKSSPSLGGLYDSLDADQQDDGHATDREATQDLPVAGSVGTEADASSRSEALVQLLKEALSTQEKPQNTTQMLAWLHQRGESANREDVMNALFLREDLFRKRGAGQWALVGREQQAPA